MHRIINQVKKLKSPNKTRHSCRQRQAWKPWSWCYFKLHHTASPSEPRGSLPRAGSISHVWKCYDVIHTYEYLDGNRCRSQSMVVKSSHQAVLPNVLENNVSLCNKFLCMRTAYHLFGNAMMLSTLMNTWMEIGAGVSQWSWNQVIRQFFRTY